MSTKSREVIWGSRIRGAKMHADHAREAARKAVREADRAEAEAWSVRMEGYGGPAQPAPTIAQCLNGGLGWLEVECVSCKNCLKGCRLASPAPSNYAIEVWTELDNLTREKSALKFNTNNARYSSRNLLLNSHSCVAIFKRDSQTFERRPLHFVSSHSAII